MNRAIVPISQLNTRLPEAGRIRLGDKRGTNGSQRKLTEFRFTSPNRDQITEVAARWGGECTPWNDPKANPSSQWQCYTKAKELVVLVPPGDGVSQSYEMWSGGGCARRCDGVECERIVGDDLVMVPCLCIAEGQMSCRPHTRLSVILPDLPFYGTWRVESKGWNAAAEIPGMFEVLEALDARGQIVRARLAVEQVERMVRGKKQMWVQPKLTLMDSVVELASGRASVAALGRAGAAELGGPALPALGAGVPVESPRSSGVQVDPDEPVDGEIVDDELLELEAKLRADADQFGLDGDRYIQAVFIQAGHDRARVAACIDKVRVGQLEPVGFTAAGGVQWERPLSGDRDE